MKPARGQGRMVSAPTREEQYRSLLAEAEAVLIGESDPILWMTTIACLVYQSFDFLWAGFYRVRERELLVGPYQGTLGCLRIPFDRGVCGACARERRTIIVPDVHAFPGHIACDSRSRSEIVVPVFDSRERLQAVFDVDSERLGAFDEVDGIFLEKLAGRMKGLAWTPGS